MKEHTDRLNVNPDVYQMGIETFIKNDNFHHLFEFIILLVQRFYYDAHFQKCMKKYANRVFLELISSSDIAYMLALIKNGKGVWDQDVRMAANLHGSGEKKMHPLFTSGKGKTRLFGKSVWMRDGLEYFYMAESNWKKVYTSKNLFSRLCSEWDYWEPADEKLKDPVRTHWTKDVGTQSCQLWHYDIVVP